jgi:hypothetical protein
MGFEMIYIKASIVLGSSVEGLRSFRWDKIRVDIVFNESLNGARIALNIMNEAKKF